VAKLGGVPVYMDQVQVVGTPASSKIAMVPETNTKRPSYAKDGEGHVFGYGTCMWLRKCDQPGEVMGSTCSATLSNVVYSGFCFTSDVGELECGFLSASDDEYGDKPISFDVAVSPNKLPSVAGVVDVEGSAPATTFMQSTPGTPNAVYRCPTGSPAKSLGSFVSKRSLSAGCMVPGDLSYSALAEVHVKEYCNAPVDYKKGCMLPGALNYDPAAKQIGTCKFLTRGCMSPTALNYNPMASLPPAPGKECIERVVGCTIQKTSYYGVDSNTPAYQSGFYGAAGAGKAGGEAYLKVSEAAGTALGLTGSSVVSYDSAANVLGGCIVAVEGCMDPTAVNYDSKATINTGTWCVPPVYGCMVPSPAYVNPEVYKNTKQTKSTIFDSTVDAPTKLFSPTTTVHVESMCGNARFGCNETGAINYDPFATVTPADSCYYTAPGCLVPGAQNFGCKKFEETTASCAVAYKGRDAVTVNFERVCRFSVTPQPSPPPPPTPPTDAYEVQGYQVIASLLLAEEPAGLDEVAVADAFRSLCGLASDTAVAVSVTAVSRRQLSPDERRRLSSAYQLTMQATVADESTANSAASTLSSALGSTGSSATAALQSAGIAGVAVSKVESVGVAPVYAEKAVVDNGGMIGGIVGGIGGLLCAIGIFFGVRYMRNKNKATYPA